MTHGNKAQQHETLIFDFGSCRTQKRVGEMMSLLICFLASSQLPDYTQPRDTRRRGILKSSQSFWLSSIQLD